MDKFVKNFIEDNVDLIESNSWDIIYEKLNKLPIWDKMFTISEITEIVLKAGIDPINYLSKIPDYYLFRKDIVDEIKLPSKITNIGDLSFQQASTLKSINLYNIEKVGIGAFAFSGLTKAEFGKKVIIETNAFTSCVNLKILKIGNNSSIEENAFEGCYILKDLYLPNNFIIKGNAFAQCGVADIYYDGNEEEWAF